MTDPVEALAAALFNQEPHDCDRDFKVCGGVILAALRASGFDVVPTGDAGLDAELRREVVRIVGNGEWWAREYAFRVLSPLAARLSSSDTEPLESDPIETFSHPFRAPVVIDGHEYRHTSDCEWPSSSDTGGHQHRWVDARNEAVTSGEVCPDCGAIRASDTGGRG